MAPAKRCGLKSGQNWHQANGTVKHLVVIEQQERNILDLKVTFLMSGVLDCKSTRWRLCIPEAL